MTGLLLTLAFFQDPPEVVPLPAPPELHACWTFAVRAGVSIWGPGGFEASTSQGTREIENDFLVEGVLETSADWHGWEFAAGAALSGGDDLRTRVGWLRLAPPPLLRLDVPLPLQLRVSGGALFGTIDVEESAFGGFDPAAGFLGRLTLESPPGSTLGLALWAEVRALAFDYEEPVLAGDDHLGGASAALGFSALVRF